MSSAPGLLRRALASLVAAAAANGAPAAPAVPAVPLHLAVITNSSSSSSWMWRQLSHRLASTSSSTRSSSDIGGGTAAAAPSSSSTAWPGGGGGEAADTAAAAASSSLPPQPHLVDQLLSVDNMSRRQQLQHRKPAIMQQFQRAPGDLGSPEVQIALLTEKLRDMSVHVLANKKDHVSKRGLQVVLNRRRKLLSYLRRANFARYAFVLHQLGLKDVYAKQARYDKYRVGSRLGTPAEPLKRYGTK